VEGYIPNRFSREDGKKMRNFIDLFRGAYLAEALSKDVWIAGLCCPKPKRASTRHNGCNVCQNACESFPLESVIDFGCVAKKSKRSSEAHLFRYKMQTFLTILSWAYMFASKEQRSRKLSWLAPGGKIFFIPRNDSCHYLEGVCVMLLLQKMTRSCML